LKAKIKKIAQNSKDFKIFIESTKARQSPLLFAGVPSYDKKKRRLT